MLFKFQRHADSQDTDCRCGGGSSEVHLLAGLDPLLREPPHHVRMPKANLQGAHAETYGNLATNFVETDDTNRPQSCKATLAGQPICSRGLLCPPLGVSSKRIGGKGIQRRGQGAAGILRKRMPSFKAATNGTSERASGDIT